VEYDVKDPNCAGGKTAVAVTSTVAERLCVEAVQRVRCKVAEFDVSELRHDVSFDVYSGEWLDVHMTYLQICVEGGIPILILYLLFIGSGFSYVYWLAAVDVVVVVGGIGYALYLKFNNPAKYESAGRLINEGL